MHASVRTQWLLTVRQAAGCLEFVSPGRSVAGIAGGAPARGTVTGACGAAGLAGATVETGTAEAAAVPAAAAGGARETDGRLGVTGEAGTAEAAAAAPAAVAGDALTTGTTVRVDAEAASCGWIEGEACGFLYVDDTTGTLLVTGGLLGPNPNPSKSPPKKPKGGMGGKRPGCAVQCCACRDMATRSNILVACHAVKGPLHV